ncbi:xanthine dehydrogenase family protein molybdopterin-binding subunit [Sphingomonas sp. AP4-R1]|uniref:aldehyde oxidoreductase molybdenum-binding subunit PaoC n=1 Tax=Sphingomonas sp. AP4-R1 TaxID=2735134 RepID=UPI0014937615|nr:aldehyde oxidoreductase molybdenum-binding subunit PaoC [Sphingomonas sp. AP4-R1]QJU58392.1 xanthine dehydrogenase family protein molybdopterin-binding subunit [Sphingomonas sp. AP4-R1]
MRFDTPVGSTPIDRQTVIGRAHPRVEGPLKVTGTARYAAEHHEVAENVAYGYILGAAIARGQIDRIDIATALAAPGVRAVVTHENVGPIGIGKFYVQRVLAGPRVDHYHQAVAVVVADTFEQARAAAALILVDYCREQGRFDLAGQKPQTPIAPDEPSGPAITSVGRFEPAFAAAPVTVDETYTVPDQAHAMMEPHATIARWDGDKLTCWTSIQQINWGVRDLGLITGTPKENIRLISSFIGGGFGGKGTTQSDLALAALAARVAGRPVKLALQRPLMFNNTIHRPKTIQRIRLGAGRDGRLLAIGHDSWSGNLQGGRTEPTTLPTRLLYRGENRLLRRYLATLDLAEGNAMRAPGEAPGMMALEIAMDELAEKLGMDPVELRIVNDTQVDPEKPARRFSTRPFVECLRTGAERFGWARRPTRPASRRDGRWLIGMGMASAIRGAPISKAGARVLLGRDGTITVETDMTDIGTGSYTIVAQTAAEMMGVPLDRVVARLGDSTFPETPGSGGQQGAASVTAGVYAACAMLRDRVTQRLGFDSTEVTFADSRVHSGGRSVPLAEAARDGEIVVEDSMEYGNLKQRFAQQTVGAHFAEVAVDAYTGAVRVRRMLAVCAAGRILNPTTARSQVIGGMTMGIGAALMEEMAVDTRFGFFVNHDLAGYEVPVHADVPHLDVHFIDEVDATMSPVKAKGVGELGLSGVAPAIANAVYNATGVRVREYPVTLDKHLEKLPGIA